jgi:2',5'-phosphodiesterase
MCSANVDLRQLFKQPLDPKVGFATSLLQASPGLAHSLQCVNTIAQIVYLQFQGDLTGLPPLVVTNTHLFFHGDAPHIRNLHVAAMIQEAARWAASPPVSPQNMQPPVLLFCGDLNSDINDGVPGVVQMLLDGELPAEFWDWEYGADFDFRETRDDRARAQEIEDARASQKHREEHDAGTQGADVHASARPSPAAEASAADGASASTGKAASAGTAHVPAAVSNHKEHGSGERAKALNTKGIEVTGVHLKLPCAFTSTHDFFNMNVTNYVPNFSGVLDYIWCEKGRVRVRQAHRVPSPEEVGGFLPNDMHPSDHLPVVADIELLSLGDVSLTAQSKEAGTRVEDKEGNRLSLPEQPPSSSLSFSKEGMQVRFHLLMSFRITQQSCSSD